MKAIRFTRIDGFEVITDIGTANGFIDPVATERKIGAELAEIDRKVTDSELDPLEAKVRKAQLFEREAEYSFPPSDTVLVDDSRAARLSRAFNSRGNNRLLLRSGEYVRDLRRKDFWMKSDGEWKHWMISEVGEDYPSGSVPTERLTAEQKAEIVAQNRAGSTAAVSE
ncbi:MAG TPA: hypothetical protein VMW87_11240 [Spirochaetia bacterium]|nr:hypothetical protein [Spirochaetia bacterium]